MEPIDSATEAELQVLFLGNSLTAGYGLPLDQAYPALLQLWADSLHWPVTMVNAGLSGETTAGGLRRLPWLFRSNVDVLVIALGGNDGLRGLPPDATKDNLRQIIDQARDTFADVSILLAGMQMPPNLGDDYTAAFSALFTDLVEEKDVHFIPFLLEGVGGVDALNQSDGIHPNAEGQRIVADNVWRVLRPILDAHLTDR